MGCCCAVNKKSIAKRVVHLKVHIKISLSGYVADCEAISAVFFKFNEGEINFPIFSVMSCIK